MPRQSLAIPQKWENIDARMQMELGWGERVEVPLMYLRRKSYTKLRLEI